MRPNWDEYFLLQAKIAAMRSTCVSRPTGCVLVRDKNILATGYNGAVSGKKHCTDLEYCQRRAQGVGDGQKDRACVAVHAEANAVAQAAKRGVVISGATAYCTLYPCAVCLKLLYAAGVTKIVYEHVYDDEQPTPLIEAHRLELSSDIKLMACNTINLATSARRLPKTG